MKLVERGPVRLSARANRDVDPTDAHSGRRAKRGQQVKPRQLAKAALEQIPIDCRMLMPGHDDPNTRRRRRLVRGNAERGSVDPDIEMHGPNSLPLSNDGLNVGAPRQPMATRKIGAVVRRLRTCPAA